MDLQFQADPHGPMLARADNPLHEAAEAIHRYAQVYRGAYKDAEPVRYRALAATYVAIRTLLSDPIALVNFLPKSRTPGTIPKNPVQPIVRKLWLDFPSRERIHIYAACLAWAVHEQIDPEKILEWLGKITIKKAAKYWKHSQRSPESKNERDTRIIKERDKLLKQAAKENAPIPLPERAAERHPGYFLAAIRIRRKKATMMAVLDQINETQVNTLIIRGLRR